MFTSGGSGRGYRRRGPRRGGTAVGWMEESRPTWGARERRVRRGEATWARTRVQLSGGPITRPQLGFPISYPHLSLIPHLPPLVHMASAEGGAYRYVRPCFFSTRRAHLPCSYSLTVFSPSGKLVQIEHALAAVSSGTTSLGIKGTRFIPIPMDVHAC